MVSLRGTLLNFARRRPLLAKSLFCLTLFGVLFGGLELFCGWRNEIRRQQAPWLHSPSRRYVTPDGKNFRSEFMQQDPLVGNKPKKNVAMRCIMKDDDKIYYDVEYRTDEFCRRITPVPEGGQRDKFLIFFGCSYTLGEGVHAEETLPAQAAKLAPGYMPYNYGVSGHGPQSMLAKLRSKTLPEEIPQRNGILIYTLIDHHVERAVGSMAMLTWWGTEFPCYELDGDRPLRHAGTFATARPCACLLYTVLGRTETCQFFQPELPRIGDEHFRLTAKILAESRDLLRQQFPGSELYVLFYPNCQRGQLVEAFNREGVKCLDYRNVLREFVNISADGHPLARSYRLVAEKLVVDLGIGALEASHEH